MLEYFDEHPDLHHEIGALDYMRFTGAPYLASIHSKLKTHKEDDRVHITDEERDKWNRKVDKTTFYELENKVLTKAEKKEIPMRLSQLQNDVPYLTAADVNNKLGAENYITKGDLEEAGYVKGDTLNNYATKDFVTNKGYLTPQMLSGMGYATQASIQSLKDYVDARVNAAISSGNSGNSGSIDIDLSNYALRSELPGRATTVKEGLIKANQTNLSDSSIDGIAHAPVNITLGGIAYVDPIIAGGTGLTVTEQIIRTWIDETYDSEVQGMVTSAWNAYKNNDLPTEVRTLAGTVADEKINASGIHLASRTASMLVAEGIVNDDGTVTTLNSAGIVAAINDAGDSAVKISADVIELNGTTIADKIEATDMYLRGHIVATNLEIVKDNTSAYIFDENLYEKGDGVFSGNVISQGYKTIVNDSGTAKSYAGATDTVTIDGTSLVFVNGLFVGSYTTPNPPANNFVEENHIHVASATASTPFKPVIRCVYNGQGSSSAIDPVPFIGETGWTSGIHFDKNTLEEIQVTISNPAGTIDHPIHTDIWTYIEPTPGATPIRRPQSVTIGVGETRTFSFNMRNAGSSLWRETKELYASLCNNPNYTTAQADRQAADKLIAFLPGGNGQLTQYVPAIWWDDREQ